MADLTPKIIGQIVQQRAPVYKSKSAEDVGKAYMEKYLSKTDVASSSNLEDLNGILSQGGPVTQGFMNYNPAVEKYSGGYNQGVDIGVPTGTKVATPQGNWKVVEESANGAFNRGYGNSVLLQNTDTGEKLRFSHLSNVLGITPGQVLGGGKVFGATGATGNVTGPHLDLEYYDKFGKLGDVMRSTYGRGL